MIAFGKLCKVAVLTLCQLSLTTLIVAQPNDSHGASPLFTKDITKKVVGSPLIFLPSNNERSLYDAVKLENGHVGESHETERMNNNFLASKTKVRENDPYNIFDVNGCSIPFGLPFFFETQFTPACNKHDLCYGCGVRHDISRRTCDQVFRENMQATCTEQIHHQFHHRFKARASQDDRNKRDKIWYLISDKESALNDILGKEMLSLKRNTSKSISVLNVFSPANIVVLRKKVMVKWLLFLNSTLWDGRFDSVGGSHIHLAIRQDLNEEKGNIPFEERKSSHEYQKILESSGALKDHHDFYNDVLKTLDGLSMTAGDHVSNFVDIHIVQALDCQFFAGIYYWVVRLFGYTRYSRPSEDFCDDVKVLKCLPL